MDSNTLIILVVSLLFLWSIVSVIFRNRRTKGIARKISENALIIDVRSASEYNSSHYQGAINIPIQKLEQSLRRIGSRKRPIILYCSTGARSSRAKAILRAHGYKNVINAGRIANLP